VKRRWDPDPGHEGASAAAVRVGLALPGEGRYMASAARRRSVFGGAAPRQVRRRLATLVAAAALANSCDVDRFVGGPSLGASAFVPLYPPGFAGVEPSVGAT